MASTVAADVRVRLPARLALLDELGVPYTLEGAPMLSWPSPAELEGIEPQWHEIACVRVFARCVDFEIARSRGEIRLPFDPDEALLNLRSEAYVREGARAAARRA